MNNDEESELFSMHDDEEPEREVAGDVEEDGAEAAREDGIDEMSRDGEEGEGIDVGVTNISVLVTGDATIVSFPGESHHKHGYELGNIKFSKWNIVGDDLPGFIDVDHHVEGELSFALQRAFDHGYSLEFVEDCWTGSAFRSRASTVQFQWQARCIVASDGESGISAFAITSPRDIYRKAKGIDIAMKRLAAAEMARAGGRDDILYPRAGNAQGIISLDPADGTSVLVGKVRGSRPVADVKADRERRKARRCVEGGKCCPA